MNSVFLDKFGKWLAVLGTIYFLLFCFFYYVMTTKKELSRMLEYSENVEIRKLRKERSDLEVITKEELLKKFNLIN